VEVVSIGLASVQKESVKGTSKRRVSVEGAREEGISIQEVSMQE